MMTITHLAMSGLFTAVMLGSSDPIAIGVGAVAGLLPDVDVAKSPAGRILFPLSGFLEKRFPHRSCTHSVLASLVVGSIVYGLAYAGMLAWDVAHAIEIGYTTGYLADLITKSGVQLFFPASVRCVVPGNRKFRLSTGSSAEYIVLVLVMVLSILTLSVNSNGGFAVAMNEILATPRGVQDLINKKGGTHQIVVVVDGVRAHDRTRVQGNYIFLEQKDAGTFLVHALDRPQELYRVSNRPDGNNQIFSERIIGNVGQRIKTDIRSMRWGDEEIAPKLVALRVGMGQVYLSGVLEVEEMEELTIESSPDRFPAIVKRGSKLEFDHCSLEHAIALLGDRWGSGTLMVKTIMGL